MSFFTRIFEVFQPQNLSNYCIIAGCASSCFLYPKIVNINIINEKNHNSYLSYFIFSLCLFPKALPPSAMTVSIESFYLLLENKVSIIQFVIMGPVFS